MQILPVGIPKTQVTSMTLTSDGHLVVGDNHERVRVSCYPEAGKFQLKIGFCNAIAIVFAILPIKQLNFRKVTYKVWCQFPLVPNDL